jgi:O-methyltransferase
MLASHGVFAEDDRGRFQLTPLAAVLQTGSADSLRDFVRFFGGDMAWNAYRDLLHTVHTGEDGFAHAYGMEFFAYLAAHPDVEALFSAGLAQVTARENAAIAGAYAFGQFARLVDVGGGRGGLLAAVLTAYPTVRGVLYEQPRVAANPCRPASGRGYGTLRGGRRRLFPVRAGGRKRIRAETSAPRLER